MPRQNMIPFAVVGSERNVIIDGKPVRGRKNRWGVINVENEQHCEFNYLRNFLTRYVPSPSTHMEFDARLRELRACRMPLARILTL
jgi:hypothetical protein